MKTIELPKSNIDVMVTYEKTIKFGDYSLQERKEIVTKRGFYSDLFKNFAIPPEYRKFNGVLLPHGFGGDKVLPEQVIKWEYCID